MSELYFLRSSEQFIVEDILSHTDRAESKIYYDLFGYREITASLSVNAIRAM